MHVKDILRYKPAIWTISPDATVYRALEYMAEKNIGALPIVAGEDLVGIFSERDYARKCILMGRSSRETFVSELMTSPVITVSPDVSAEECLALMTEQKIRHLPVVQNDRLVGIVSIGDIGKALIAEQRVAISDLEGYITGYGFSSVA